MSPTAISERGRVPLPSLHVVSSSAPGGDTVRLFDNRWGGDWLRALIWLCVLHPFEGETFRARHRARDSHVTVHRWKFAALMNDLSLGAYAKIPARFFLLWGTAIREAWYSVTGVMRR